MNVICIDDERLALEYLKGLLGKIEEIKEIDLFLLPSEALDFMRNHRIDVVFLDIEMYQENGIDIAKKIKYISPQTSIIFVTAYSHYAVEAFKTRASGYLLKPALLKDIKEELNNLKLKPEVLDYKVKIVCFGNFDIYVNNKSLHFKRSKSLELLAYLVDKRGTCVTANELICALWENKEPDKSSRSMFHNLLTDISETLTENDASFLFLKNRNSYAVSTDGVDCDYFRFLNGDVRVINSFNGEYMASYPWAMFTNSFLQSKVSKDEK